MNAAAVLVRHNLSKLNDEEWMRSNGLSVVTSDFVRHDRRRITPEPPADRHGWLTATIA